MIDPDGLESELRRTRAQLEEAKQDRHNLRRQLAETQKMFHLACRDRDEAQQEKQTVERSVSIWCQRAEELEGELNRVTRQRDEAQTLAREYLDGLWSELPESSEWKQQAVASEIERHPWLKRQ